MGDWFAQNAPKQSSGDWFAQNAPPPAAPNEQPQGVAGHVGNFAKNFWQELANAGQGMVDMVTTRPDKTLKGIGEAQDQLRLKAQDAIKRGDYVEAARHAVSWLIPMAGPAIDARGDQAQAGDVSGALGGAASIAAQNILPAKVPAIVEAAPTVAKAAKGAAKGAISESLEPVSFNRYGVPVSAPRIAVEGAAGGAAAAMVGLPKTAGAAVGAGRTVVRGAVKGAREALRGKVQAVVEELQATPGKELAKTQGLDWAALSAEERALMENAARAQENVARQPVGPREATKPPVSDQNTAQAIDNTPITPVDELPASPTAGMTVADVLRAELEANRAPAVEPPQPLQGGNKPRPIPRRGDPIRPPLRQPEAPPLPREEVIPQPSAVPAVVESPVPVSGGAAAAPALETPAPATGSPATLAQLLAEEMVRSGTVDASQVIGAPKPPAPAPAPKPDLAPVMRDLSPAMRKETAKANYRAAQEGAPAADPGSVYAAAARATKADALAEALHKHGISATDADLIDPGQWGSLAKAVGQKSPSLATIKEVKLSLANREKAGANAQPSPTIAVEEPYAGIEAAAPMDGGASSQGSPANGSSVAGAGRFSGQTAEILIPGESRSLQARYEVRELADVHPSHHGKTFGANQRYSLKNERDYSKPENQQRVIENSSEERFNPRYHVTDNPDATNGPVVIDEGGNALGGNSRAMILQRVYDRGGRGAAAYRALLEEKAAQFGVPVESLRGMKQPVLVRVVPDAELQSLPGGSRWAVRKTNVSGTAQLSAAERSAADAGQLSPELTEHIAGHIEAAGADATLNDALSGKSGAQIVNKLISEGFFSEQERPALMDGRTGALTQLAKERISKALLGQFFRDSDQIMRTSPAIKAKLERIAAPLSRVQGAEGWDLTPVIREAIDLEEYARAHGVKNLEDVVAQQDMFGSAPKWSPDAIKIAEWLRDANPNDLVSAVRKYVNDKEPTMFGEISPGESFALHFEESQPRRKSAGR